MCTLESLRKRIGLDQKQVAYEVHVSAPTVSQWETGKKKPSKENIARLSKLYGVSMDYLMKIVLGERPDQEEVPAAIRDLSLPEIQLIRNYRELDDANKQGAQKYIEFLLSQQKKAIPMNAE